MAELLDGKVAVITGGGRGIGRATALAMASCGARIVVADIFRDESGAEAAASVVGEIEALGGQAVACDGDVTSPAGATKIMDRAIENFGRLDILVLCAGNFIVAPFLELTEEQWDRSIAVHIKGHFLCSQAAVRHMLPQGFGRIVTVGSRAAFGTPVPAYATSKAGVMGFTAALSRELKDTGVTVNCLIPSARTQLFPLAKGQRIFGGIPPAHHVDPEYVAPLLVYLASDDAGDITGRYFYASGGDIVLYEHPMQVHAIIRNEGKWEPEAIGASLKPILESEVG